MLPRRKVSTANTRMFMFIISNFVRHNTRQLNLRTASWRCITPVVTSTIFPTLTINALPSLVFLTRRRAIIIPIGRMGDVQVHEAVRMRVAILHISVTNRWLRYRPVYSIFNVRVFTRSFTRQGKVVVRVVGRNSRFNVIIITFSFRFFLGFHLVMIKVINGFSRIFISVRFGVVSFMRLTIFIRSIHLRYNFIRLFSLHMRTMVIRKVQSTNLIFRVRIRRLHTRTRRLIGTLSGIMHRFITRARTVIRVFIRYSNTLSAPLTFTTFRLSLMIFLLGFA